MEKIILSLKKTYPQFAFKRGNTAQWIPEEKCIIYSMSDNSKALWDALHELGHALSGHTTYSSDMGLLHKETEAWDKAFKVSKLYGISISKDHIQDSLDTYRDWLFKRSTCPACEGHGLQVAPNSYNCHNCRSYWRVNTTRFCRPYRTLN